MGKMGAPVPVPVGKGMVALPAWDEEAEVVVAAEDNVAASEDVDASEDVAASEEAVVAGADVAGGGVGDATGVEAASELAPTVWPALKPSGRVTPFCLAQVWGSSPCERRGEELAEGSRNRGASC